MCCVTPLPAISWSGGLICARCSSFSASPGVVSTRAADEDNQEKPPPPPVRRIYDVTELATAMSLDGHGRPTDARAGAVELLDRGHGVRDHETPAFGESPRIGFPSGR